MHAFVNQTEYLIDLIYIISTLYKRLHSRYTYARTQVKVGWGAVGSVSRSAGMKPRGLAVGLSSSVVVSGYFSPFSLRMFALAGNDWRWNGKPVAQLVLFFFRSW